MLSNAEVVGKTGYTKCPTLLFSSNGKQLENHWTKYQKEFASMLNAKLVCYDCGHYIHHYESDEMCEEIINFVDSLERQL